MDSLYVMGFPSFILEPCKTSPGKNAIFLSIYLPHLHRKLSDSFGLWFVRQPYPVYSALYVISVRQTRDLPLTSFRFHLTVDTLVLSYVLGTIYPHSGLSPVRLRPCWAHPKRGSPAHSSKRSSFIVYKENHAIVAWFRKA